MSNDGRHAMQVNYSTQTSTDKIELHAMQFYGYHGVLEAEKTLGQIFIVHLQLQLDLQAAGTSDDIQKTISYAEVFEDVKFVVEKQRYELLEALAENIARTVIENNPTLEAVTVSIEKPQAPIVGVFQYAGVEITRTRLDVMEERQYYIALGSNVGDKLDYIRQAVKKITELEQVIYIEAAHVYETKPHGITGQNNYYNTMISVRSSMHPELLLRVLQDIENHLGRERPELWAPRTIDIDIIACEKMLLIKPTLTIPHRRMHEREFVLAPLLELTEDWIHPYLLKNVAEMYADVEKFGAKKICLV